MVYSYYFQFVNVIATLGSMASLSFILRLYSATIDRQKMERVYDELFNIIIGFEGDRVNQNLTSNFSITVFLFESRNSISSAAWSKRAEGPKGLLGIHERKRKKNRKGKRKKATFGAQFVALQLVETLLSDARQPEVDFLHFE